MNINKPSDNFLSLPGFHRTPKGNKELRLPFVGFLPNKWRNHFIAMMGEFTGTFLFLFFAFAATQVANKANSGADTSDGSLSAVPNANTLMYISLAFGFSLAVNAWVFFRISGGELTNHASHDSNGPSMSMLKCSCARSSVSELAETDNLLLLGLFNPAVTLGMALIGAVTWTRAGLIFIAQILGSMVRRPHLQWSA